LPLTNCCFNKNGDKFITGSYDRTCKVWDTMTGEELLSLEGHKNVVYCMAFNNPFGYINLIKLISILIKIIFLKRSHCYRIFW